MWTELYRRLYAWACQRLYHEFAWSYDAVSWLVSGGRWSRWRRSALTYLPARVQSSHGRVLELGFGTGELLLDMTRAARGGAFVAGVELSPAMQRIAAAKFAAHGLDAARVRARTQALPFAAGSFDAILCTFPAEYIFDPATLDECARLLRPDAAGAGGRLIILGLWVRLDHPVLGRLRLPFFGEAEDAFVQEMQRRLSRAGFDATVMEHADGVARVGMIVAQA